MLNKAGMLSMMPDHTENDSQREMDAGPVIKAALISALAKTALTSSGVFFDLGMIKPYKKKFVNSNLF
jgi:hypothetical protein